jgi:uncharacterized protein
VDVFILEYPGFGAREGAPSQSSLIAAADEAFVSLPNQGALYLVSESLGTGVAAHLAGAHPSRISGIAMFTPYDDLAGVAQHRMPFVPARLVLRDRFRPALWLKAYRGPVMVVLAGEDVVIPKVFGRRLYDSYSGPKAIQVISGAHHSDAAVQLPEWWKKVFAFWEEHRGNEGP